MSTLLKKMQSTLLKKMQSTLFEKNAVFLGSRFAKKTISFWDTNLASTNSNNEPEPELKPETQPNIVNLTAHYEPVLFSELVSLKIQIRSCTLI